MGFTMNKKTKKKTQKEHEKDTNRTQKHTNKNVKECSKNVKEEKTISEIKDLRSRFSHDVIKLIDEYWNVVKKTRKTNSISYSVILKTMNKWSKFEEVIIKYALKKHIESYDDGERDENYTLGIMRNTTPEEAEDLLNRGIKVNISSHKKQNKWEPDNSNNPSRQVMTDEERKEKMKLLGISEEDYE